MTSFDAIIVGGGHNALVCAAALGKAGRRVLVLEAADGVGGAARTEEFAPGFRVSGLAHVLNRLHPDVVKALDLARHGLKLGAPRMPTVSLAGNGEPLVLEGAYGESLGGATAAEAAAWRELRAQLLRFAGILKPMLAHRPPDTADMSLGEMASLAKVGLALRRLGREDMRDFLRMMLMNVHDVAEEHLADDRLKGLLAFDAVLGSHLGPRSPTSLLGLYYRLAGEIAGAPGAQALPIGGMGAVADAMRGAAEAAGVSVRTGAEVAAITVERGRAGGVVLGNGERLAADIVVSGINPVVTFRDLVGAREVDTGFLTRLRHVRMNGDAAKLHLALDRPPGFPGVAEADLAGRIVIALSSDHVERAFNPSKYGEFSPEPVMEITMPSLADPSLAPAGACVLSAVVQYAPYRLKEGWEAGRPKLLEAILTQIENHAPGVRKLVRHAELLTPLDIEQRYRMPGGHWHHGELQADQMLMSRPVFGAAGYDTPVERLFLCGAGSHPGGGVSGIAGLNAARRIIGMRA